MTNPFIDELLQNARLDWGLGEVLRTATPPDLTPRILAALERKAQQRMRRLNRLRGAAALLFGLAYPPIK